MKFKAFMDRVQRNFFWRITCNGLPWQPCRRGRPCRRRRGSGTWRSSRPLKRPSVGKPSKFKRCVQKARTFWTMENLISLKKKCGYSNWDLVTVNAEFSVAPQTAVVFEFDALWHVPVSNTVEKNHCKLFTYVVWGSRFESHSLWNKFRISNSSAVDNA